MRLSSSAYTLVELLIALTLSLILLLGIAELFQRVSGNMNETRSAMSASAHLNETALLLRQDLARIPSSLPSKPQRIAAEPLAVSDSDGYLEIIEGPDSVLSHPYVDEGENPDATVGDVDDIIGFTAKANPAVPFRGVIRGKVVERDYAEIVWFVRGNTLFRRVRLIDDVTADENTTLLNFNDDKKEFPTKADLDRVPPTETGLYAIVEADETNDGGLQRYDAVIRDGDLVWVTLLTLDDLARRARRFGHDGIEYSDPLGAFPYPLYAAPYDGWYYLRMPTLEETNYWSSNNIPHWKTNSTVPRSPEEENPDLWEQPYFFPSLQDRKSGSLLSTVASPRYIRAGEDVVLTNVLSFDIKVWDPRTKEFVDLGTKGTDWEQSNQLDLPNTWDSWTRKYVEGYGVPRGLPPYTNPLQAIRITIRCFDPASQIIRQVTVVHRFKG